MTELINHYFYSVLIHLIITISCFLLENFVPFNLKSTVPPHHSQVDWQGAFILVFLNCVYK